MNSKQIVDHLLSRFNELDGQRMTYIPTWDEISEFIMPHRGDFSATRTAGSTNKRRLFDSTAIQSNEYLASMMHSGLTSGTSKWFSFQSRNKDMQKDHEVQMFFEDVSSKIFNVLNNPLSNFPSQNHELMLDLTGYGTACMYIDQRPGEPIRFKTIHLSEVFIAEDIHGIVDTVFRKFEFSARQAIQFWPEEKLSKDLIKLAKDSPDQKITFLHCVYPNENYEIGQKKSNKLPFISYYIDETHNHLIDESGYHEMPYLVPRWAKLIGEVYGRSPTWNALSDIKLLNTVVKTTLIAMEKAVDPTLLVANEGVMLPLRTSPGALIFGGIDPLSGREQVRPLHTQADLNAARAYILDLQKSVRSAYHIDPTINNPIDRETATAANYRQQDRLRIIAPQINRIDTEYVSKLIARVYGILARSKQLVQIDPRLAQEIEKYGIEIIYNSSLVKSQRFSEIEAKQRLLQMYLPLAQADPSLLQLFDFHESLRQDADILGVPVSILVSDEELQERQQAQQMQQAIQMATQVAQDGSQAALNFAKAGSIDGGGNV